MGKEKKILILPILSGLTSVFLVVFIFILGRQAIIRSSESSEIYLQSFQSYSNVLSLTENIAQINEVIFLSENVEMVTSLFARNEELYDILRANLISEEEEKLFQWSFEELSLYQESVREYLKDASETNSENFLMRSAIMKESLRYLAFFYEADIENTMHYIDIDSRTYVISTLMFVILGCGGCLAFSFIAAVLKV